MKKLFLAVLVLITTVAATPVQTQTPQPRTKPRSHIEVGPRETTELLSVIMHLSGAAEYNDNILPEYRTLVDSTFGQWRRHLAVELASQLRQYGLAYDRPMTMAVDGHIDGDGNFHTPYTPGDYHLWDEQQHSGFLSAISDFYRDTGFHAFYIENAEPFYCPVLESLGSRYNSIIDVGWLNRFTGEERETAYFVTLSYLNGRHNSGVAKSPVVGLGDGEDNPMALNDDATLKFAMILLHEYLHPYINPLKNKYIGEFEAAGEVIFEQIREQITRNGYTTWELALNETLDWAAAIVYMRTRNLDSDVIIDMVEARGFWWIDRLADKLGEYEKQRDKYPTLESFMPEIVKFYENLAAEVANS
jgi:hypothetical protein